MLVIDAATTRAALPFPALIPALKRMFQSACEAPSRHVHTVEVKERQPGTVLLMPAWIEDGYLGIKTVCVFPGNVESGIPTLHATYALYDARTGVPLAQIDGNEITARRTAAASALAASYLARKTARTLLVVGAGRVASLLADAYSVVFALARVIVWNIHSRTARSLVDELRTKGYAAELAEDLEAAVRAADIVSCATASTDPLIQGSWLRPGAHLDLIGGFTPQMREADDACFLGTSVFVDNEEALIKSGDILAPIRNGVLAAKDIKETLRGLCRGLHPGRSDCRETTVFKAVGIATEDLAAALLAYEEVRAAAAAEKR